MKPPVARARAWLRKQGSLAVPLALLVAATLGVVGQVRQPAARAAPRYRCRDLGTLGGRQAEATDLNNLGHVVGDSRVAGSGAVHAFLHDGEQLIDLGGRPGWANSKGLGIDDAGRVVGAALVGSGAARSWRTFLLDLSSGRLRYLDPPASGGLPEARWRLLPRAFTAHGLGSAGEVVGVTRFRDQRPHPRACLWGDAGPTDLGTLGGGSSAGYAINRSGWVVGEAQTPSGDQHAFLWVNGGMRDLGTLGGYCSAAQDVNDRGEIVGDTAIEGEQNRAFVWRRGRMHDLGALPGGTDSIAHAINNAGQIVGASDVPVRPGSRELIAGSGQRMPPQDHLSGAWERAVLWQAGAIYDLNQLCHAPGVLLLQAHSINDRGQILANGRTSAGEVHPFLLTPLEREAP